jgi:hypothetical protein
MADVTVIMNPAALDVLLNSPQGPAGEIIMELSVQAAGMAKALAPVMKQRNYSHWGKYFDPRYQYGPPGDTRRSVRWSGYRYNGIGQIYSGVNVNYGPTLFLERPAEQIHSTDYMFMTDALDSVHL